jgi:hypothetical protein
MSTGAHRRRHAVAATGCLLLAVGGTLLSGIRPAQAAPAPALAPAPAPTASPTSGTGPTVHPRGGARVTAGPHPSGIRLRPAPPSPTAPASGPPPDVGGQPESGGGCGFLDVGCHVTAAIDGWFTDLVRSALNPVLGLLGRSVLATPDVTGGRAGDLWAVTLGIADSLLVLLVLAGGAVVMGHETLQTRYTVKDVLPRMVVAVVAANASLALVGAAVTAANALSAALLGGGVNPGDAGAMVSKLVLSPLVDGGAFLVLLGLVAAVLAVLLVVTYLLRVAVLVLLVAGAPLLLVCHALPGTDGLARLWWRGIAAALGVQVAQAFMLITAVRVFLAADGTPALGLSAGGGLVDLLVGICLLYLLVRIPGWGVRLAFAGTGHRPSSAIRMVKTAVVYKAVRAGIAAL